MIYPNTMKVGRMIFKYDSLYHDYPGATYKRSTRKGNLRVLVIELVVLQCEPPRYKATCSLRKWYDGWYFSGYDKPYSTAEKAVKAAIRRSHVVLNAAIRNAYSLRQAACDVDDKLRGHTPKPGTKTKGKK